MASDMERARLIENRLRAMHANGTSPSELARIFNLPEAAIWQVLGIVPEPLPPPTLWQRLLRRK